MKSEHIDSTELLSLVRSGDVILFSNKFKEKSPLRFFNPSFLIQFFTKSPWNHVAVVAKEEDANDKSKFIYEYASPKAKISKKSIKQKLEDPTLTEVSIVRSKCFKSQSQAFQNVSFNKLEENFKAREKAGDYNRCIALRSASPLYIFIFLAFKLMFDALMGLGYIFFNKGGCLLSINYSFSILIMLIAFSWLYNIYRKRDVVANCCKEIVFETKERLHSNSIGKYDSHLKYGGINGGLGDFCSGYVLFAYGLLGGDISGVKPFHTVPNPGNLASHYLKNHEFKCYRLTNRKR